MAVRRLQIYRKILNFSTCIVFLGKFSMGMNCRRIICAMGYNCYAKNAYLTQMSCSPEFTNIAAS